MSQLKRYTVGIIGGTVQHNHPSTGSGTSIKRIKRIKRIKVQTITKVQISEP